MKNFIEVPKKEENVLINIDHIFHGRKRKGRKSDFINPSGIQQLSISVSSYDT